MRRYKRLVVWVLTFILCLGLFGCNNQAFRKDNLCVTVIDVGHGDSILITAPGGHAMLIDTGLSEQRDAVKRALDEAGVDSLDLLLLTHPDSDHIGNASFVLKNYAVGEVNKIGRENDTKTYRELLDTIKSLKITVRNVKAGDTFQFGDALCRYLNPISIKTPDVNNASAVLRMEYKNTVFLFMGDAQWTAESMLLTTSPDLLDADVIKVGHHALNSTSTAFLKAVTPDIALVSTDDPKKSDDPKEHRETLLNIAGLSKELFRTDENGDILLICDGSKITVKTEK